MKWILYLTFLSLLSTCAPEKPLSSEEIPQIKSDIIKRYSEHVKDLTNRDYERVMTFYANVDDFVLFGDGNYWGDYITIDQIWNMFLEDVKEIYKWDLMNHHIS